jgi:hypothetical protein
MTKRSHRDVFHPHTIKMLHHHQIWTRSQETGKFSQQEPGSADIMCHMHGGCAIEVKTASAGTFRFPEWRENQRFWARDYEEQTGNIYWLAIWYEGDYTPAFHHQRKFLVPYLIPRMTLLATEVYIPQDSIPYQVRKGMDTWMQENHADAFTLWANYSLEYAGNGRFYIPDEHPFHKLYQLNPQEEI